MKAKRWLIAILAIALVATMVCAVACDNHVHNYSEWGKSDTQHWKYCPDDNEEEVGSRANHVYGDDGKCECGAEDPNPAPSNVYTGKLDGMDVTITLNGDGSALVSGSTESHTYELNGNILTLIYESGAKEYLELNATEHTFIQLDALYGKSYTAENGSVLAFDGKGSATLGTHTGTYEILEGEWFTKYLSLTIGGETYEIEFEDGVGSAINVTITIDGTKYVFGAGTTEEPEQLEISDIVGVWKKDGSYVYISEEGADNWMHIGSIIINGECVLLAEDNDDVTILKGRTMKFSSVEIKLGSEENTILIGEDVYEYSSAIGNAQLSVSDVEGPWQDEELGIMFNIDADGSVATSLGYDPVLFFVNKYVVMFYSYEFSIVLYKDNGDLVGYYTEYNANPVEAHFEATVLDDIDVSEIIGVWTNSGSDKVVITDKFASGSIVALILINDSEMYALKKGLGTLEGDYVTVSYKDGVLTVISYNGDEIELTNKGAFSANVPESTFEGTWIHVGTGIPSWDIPDYSITIEDGQISHNIEEVENIKYTILGEYMIVHYQMYEYGDYSDYFYMLHRVDDTLVGAWNDESATLYSQDALPGIEWSDGYIGTFKSEDGKYVVVITEDEVSVTINGVEATVEVVEFGDYDGFTLMINGSKFYLMSVSYGEETISKLNLVDTANGYEYIMLTRYEEGDGPGDEPGELEWPDTYEGTYVGEDGGKTIIVVITDTTITITIGNDTYNLVLDDEQGYDPDYDEFKGTWNGKPCYITVYPDSNQVSIMVMGAGLSGQVYLERSEEEEPDEFTMDEVAGVWTGADDSELIISTVVAGGSDDSDGSIILNGEFISIYQSSTALGGYDARYRSLVITYNKSKATITVTFWGYPDSDDDDAEPIIVAKMTFSNKAELPANAELSTFVGEWKRDNQQVLKINVGGNHTVGSLSASHIIVGKYIVVSYISGNETSRFVLEKNGEKQLKGYFTAPEKAPIATTFTFVEPQVSDDPSLGTMYYGSVSVTSSVAITKIQLIDNASTNAAIVSYKISGGDEQNVTVTLSSRTASLYNDTHNLGINRNPDYYYGFELVGAQYRLAVFTTESVLVVCDSSNVTYADGKMTTTEPGTGGGEGNNGEKTLADYEGSWRGSVECSGFYVWREIKIEDGKISILDEDNNWLSGGSDVQITTQNYDEEGNLVVEFTFRYQAGDYTGHIVFKSSDTCQFYLIRNDYRGAKQSNTVEFRLEV